MARHKHPIGYKFHKLTVLSYDGSLGRYLCVCDCGAHTTTNSAQLCDAYAWPRRHCGCEPRKKQEVFKPVEDLVGRTFGRLTVTRYAGRTKSGNQVRWECKCSCGNIVTVQSSRLKSKNTKSCGCLKKEKATKPKKDPSLTLRKRLFATYIRNANRRNLEFALTFEYFCELTEKKCYYCGAEPERVYYRSERVEYHYIKTNGIDRADNNGGYSEQNSVPCCEICNRGKSNLTPEAWESHIARLVSFRSHHE